MGNSKDLSNNQKDFNEARARKLIWYGGNHTRELEAFD
jgi:hypothetical protein